MNKGGRVEGTRRLQDVTTVKLADIGVTKIESHRLQAIARKYEGGRGGQPVGRKAIAKFLNWPEGRVKDALEQLNAIDEGKAKGG